MNILDRFVHRNRKIADVGSAFICSLIFAYLCGGKTEGTLAPIKRIVDVFDAADGVKYFRISWKDTWEPEEHLISCQDELEQFWKNREKGIKSSNLESGSSVYTQTDPNDCNPICPGCTDRVSKVLFHKSTQSHSDIKCCIDASVQCVIQCILQKDNKDNTTNEEANSKQTSVLFPEEISQECANLVEGVDTKKYMETNELYDKCESYCQTELFSRDYALQHQADVKSICIQVNSHMCSRGVQVTPKVIQANMNSFTTMKHVCTNKVCQNSLEDLADSMSNGDELYISTLPVISSDSKNVVFTYSSEEQRLNEQPSDDIIYSESVDTFLKRQFLKTIDHQGKREMLFYTDNPIDTTTITSNEVADLRKFTKKRQPACDNNLDNNAKQSKRHKTDFSSNLQSCTKSNPKDVYGRSLFPNQLINGSQGVVKLPARVIPNASLPLQAVNPHHGLVTISSINQALNMENTTCEQATNTDFVKMSDSSMLIKKDSLTQKCNTITSTVQPVGHVFQAMSNVSSVQTSSTHNVFVRSSSFPQIKDVHTSVYPVNQAPAKNCATEGLHSLSPDYTNRSVHAKTGTEKKTEISLDESFASTVYNPNSPDLSVSPARENITKCSLKTSAAAAAEERKIHNDFISKYWK